MVSLFFILFLVATVFFIVKLIKGSKSYNNYDEDVEHVYFTLIIVFGIFSIVFFIWVVSLIGSVGTAHTVDEKIAMYEAENTAIEERVEATVKNYMHFEATTYGEFKDEDAFSLVSLFPELKSDTLVQQQIEVYVANSQKIKVLKEEKIDLSKAKFKLYFGR